MKLVLNKGYGGFGLNEHACALLGGADNLMRHQNSVEFRCNPKLVGLVELLGSEALADDYASLRVIEIPDGFTDIELNEYDGYEQIIYVVDGKIHRA